MDVLAVDNFGRYRDNLEDRARSSGRAVLALRLMDRAPWLHCFVDRLRLQDDLTRLVSPQQRAAGLPRP